MVLSLALGARQVADINRRRLLTPQVKPAHPLASVTWGLRLGPSLTLTPNRMSSRDVGINILKIILVTFAVFASAVALDSLTAEGELESSIRGPTRSVKLLGQTQDHVGVVEVLQRFTDAGLDLPPLTVEFAKERAECAGRDGRYDGNRYILICVPTTFAIAHEIAHAWEAHTLHDADRESYRALWNAPTWGSYDYPWNHRATERAANTIAWALTIDTPPSQGQIRDHLCTYEALTGQALPNPIDATCPPPVTVE